jgi:hypothetical protein
MPYTAEEMACDEIDAAREAVLKAEESYRKGGSIDTLNKTNRRLADAYDAQYEIAGGVIPVQ